MYDQVIAFAEKEKVAVTRLLDLLLKRDNSRTVREIDKNLWDTENCNHDDPLCVVMRFEPSSNKIESNPFYGMDEIRLKVVEEEKDLGIVFDKELSFNNHISCIVKKSNSLVGMIRRSFYHLDMEMFKCLFTAIVRPHLEYGAAIWNPHLKKHIIAIENVQRRATKLVPGLLNLPYPERLKALRLPTLLYRRYRGDMIEMYKITHDIYDQGATQFISFRSNVAVDRHFRGHNYTIFKEQWKKDVRRYSFQCRITDQWNNLPEYVINSDGLNVFKSLLDKLWENSMVMYEHEIDFYKITSSRQVRFRKRDV